MADGYRRLGIESSIFVIPQALPNDAEFRASFPGLSATSNINGFEPPVGWLRAADIPRPENRWRGSNRGGWSYPAFERLVDAYDTSLARGERNQQIVQLMQIVSEELPGIALYYNFGVVAHVAELQGPRLGSSNWSWNLHEWTWG
jgi:ABC-type transport system substrate-binding protein